MRRYRCTAGWLTSSCNRQHQKINHSNSELTKKKIQHNHSKLDFNHFHITPHLWLPRIPIIVRTQKKPKTSIFSTHPITTSPSSTRPSTNRWSHDDKNIPDPCFVRQEEARMCGLEALVVPLRGPTGRPTSETSRLGLGASSRSSATCSKARGSDPGLVPERVHPFSCGFDDPRRRRTLSVCGLFRLEFESFVDSHVLMSFVEGDVEKVSMVRFCVLLRMSATAKPLTFRIWQVTMASVELSRAPPFLLESVMVVSFSVSIKIWRFWFGVGQSASWLSLLSIFY